MTTSSRVQMLFQINFATYLLSIRLFQINFMVNSMFQVMGGGVPRDDKRVWDGEVAAGERGPGPRQHRLCGGRPAARLPHHRLQQPGQSGGAPWQDVRIHQTYSQVDKILDVRLVQPGTRIGQASECFVYWKDPSTSDTWGLNFTSPIDAKQFRECCVSSDK